MGFASFPTNLMLRLDAQNKTLYSHPREIGELSFGLPVKSIGGGGGESIAIHGSVCRGELWATNYGSGLLLFEKVPPISAPLWGTLSFLGDSAFGGIFAFSGIIQNFSFTQIHALLLLSSLEMPLLVQHPSTATRDAHGISYFFESDSLDNLEWVGGIQRGGSDYWVWE